MLVDECTSDLCLPWKNGNARTLRHLCHRIMIQAYGGRIVAALLLPFLLSQLDIFDRCSPHTIIFEFTSTKRPLCS